MTSKKYDPKLFRTDYSDNHVWSKLCVKILKPNKEHGFLAHVELVSSPKYKAKSVDTLKQEVLHQSYNHLFFFVVDSLTINHRENPILCISLDSSDPVDRFRVTPENMWIVENNLSTSNLIFEEFLHSLDNEGIYRTSKNT